VKDLIDEINAVNRAVQVDGENASVILRRSYVAEVTDVWDAITNPERIGRWFLPVSGDLQLGGKYQLEGNAGGEVLRCEPPRLLKVSWVFGEGMYSEVEVRLSADGPDRTDFELEHVAKVDPQMWGQFGPGAVGVGWDLAVLGLAMYLGTGKTVENPTAWQSSPQARQLMTSSSNSWGDALRATGTTPEAEVARMIENTTNFYAPPQ
jgi:uncharacterized protein YndB with AHSA1/START domain